MNPELKKIADIINNGKSFLIASHRDPDGDAYSSSLALALGLRQLGKQAEVVNESGIIDFYRFFPGIDEIKSVLPDKKFDAVLVCDCATLGRMGADFEQHIPKCGPLVNIDHHNKSNSHFGEVNYLSDLACSAAEMVYDVLQSVNVKLDADISTLLLSGIYTDTVSLQRGIKSAETFNKVAALFAAGARMEHFINNFFWNKAPNLVKFDAELISNHLNILNNGRYAEVIIPDELLKKHNLSPKDCDSLKDKGLSISGIEIATLIRFEEGQWKISLRSKNPVDCNNIATALGGGGHPGASAVKWKGELTELLQKLHQEINKELARLSPK